MTATDCVTGCGRPAPDGYACTTCVGRAAQQLAELVQLTPAALDVAHRQNRRGEGGSSGKPGSQLPIALRDTEKLTQVRAQLHRIGAKVWTVRGTYPPFTASVDPIIVIARWLPSHLEWIRHREDTAIDALATINASIRIVAGIVNGPNPGRYAGPCSTVDADGRVCGEDVTARPGADFGACTACGAEYDVDEQQAWMRKEIEGYLARPTEIAGMLLRLGFPVGYSTIAAYAAKGQLIAHGSDEKGRPLFRIGDVIDLRMEANKPRRSRQRSRGAANPHGG